LMVRDREIGEINAQLDLAAGKSGFRFSTFVTPSSVGTIHRGALQARQSASDVARIQTALRRIATAPGQMMGPPNFADMR
jgi:hypothetical protein